MNQRFMPTTIENDPTYQQFHARAIPLGSPDNIDWSQCGLAKIGSSRRVPREVRVATSLSESDSAST